ncbi:hypothetical protein A2U01_0037461, partial [Trifolium medium]|nr:hypothetical protein [Trifolium medium]
VKSEMNEAEIKKQNEEFRKIMRENYEEDERMVQRLRKSKGKVYETNDDDDDDGGNGSRGSIIGVLAAAVCVVAGVILVEG